MTATCDYLSLSSNCVYSNLSFAYVVDHSGKIKEYASLLGASAGAIAGIMAEESNSYFSSQIKNDVSDQYALRDLDPITASQAFIAGGFPGLAAYLVVGVISPRSHQDWEYFYDNAISAGYAHTGLQDLDKILNPVLMDLGKANFKMATAIKLIADYLAENPDDELGVESYLYDFPSLAADLVNDENEITVKLYALMAVEAEDFFLDHAAYGSDWDGLPQEFKDALIVTYCNFGKESMLDRYNGVPVGQPYEPLPGFGTAGGLNHLANASDIGDALGIPSYGDNVSGVPDFSQYTEGANGYAYRYALYNLRSVVLTTLDYNSRNADGVLDDLSAQWLEDRQQMLSLRVVDELNDDAPVGSDASYIDFITWRPDNVEGTGDKMVVFGAEGSDSIAGGSDADRLYGGGGHDSLHGGDGDDYIEGGAGIDVLNPGTGFDRLNGGSGSDIYQIEPDFGDVIIKDDSGGMISLLDGVTFRRVGEGEANTNGLYIAVDAEGEWQSEKEGWSVSVSGTTATVTTVDANGEHHIIAIENFNISTNKFGIDFQKAPEVEMPSPVSPFTVPEDGYLGTYNPPDDGEPVAVYMTQNRVENNNEDAIAVSSQFDVEQYRDKSLVYNAADFWEEWNSGDMRWIHKDDLHKAEDYYDSDVFAVRPDHVLLYETRAALRRTQQMRFEGSSQNDALYGKDWTSQVQAIKTWDDANDHVFKLNEIAGFDPAVHGNNDVLFGLDGDDLIIGDGDQGVLTQVPESQKGNRDILVGGRGSDVIYGMGGDDGLYGMEEFRTGWGGASVGLTVDPAKYDTFMEALFNNAYLYDKETGRDTETLIALEDKKERNYLNGGDGKDVIEGASFDDVIDGGNDKDFIYAGAGRDAIAGGDGDDEISGDSYAYFVTGEARSDFIAPDALPEEGDYRRAYFFRKDGDAVVLRHDFDMTSDFNDVIDGGAGSDLIQGEIGADTISGGTGSDTLFGDRVFGAGYFIGSNIPPGYFQSLSRQFHGNDFIDGGEGSDLIVGGGADDHLLGGNDSDVIYGDVGLDTIESGMNTGSSPNVGIKASDDGWWGKDLLIGGSGADVLVGEGNDDTLDGGDGDDFLYGDWASFQAQAFADTNAKTGNDILYGGAGNDRLMGNSGNDTLYGGSGDDVLYGDSVRNPGGGNIYTGTGDDVLEGGAGNDFLHGGNGNDTLNGGTGNDTLQGGNGDDVYLIDAGGGIDVIQDTSGTSTLNLSHAAVKTVIQGETAIIYLSYDGGHRVEMSLDTLRSIGTFNAGQDSVSLKITAQLSGTGIVTGSRGDDVIQFDAAYVGQHTLIDSGGNDVVQLTDSWLDNGYQKVVVNTRDVNGKNWDDYLLSNNAHPSGQIKVAMFDWVDVGEFQLDDGDGIHLDIEGNAYGNILYGKSGNDVIAGYGGNDTLYGGAGNDTLYGDSGVDKLYGGIGNDVLYVDNSSEWAYGEDGNDHFYAVEGTRGGRVVGGVGADTFHVSAANVNTGYTSCYDIMDERFDKGDMIQLDVTSDRVHLTYYGIEVISDIDTEQHLVMIYQFGSSLQEYWDRQSSLSIRFADGEVWDAETIKNIVMAGSPLHDNILGDNEANTLHGGAGNDFIAALDGDDVIYGDEGDDDLRGGTGNDILYGGLGNDVLSGGVGDDVFHFGTGQGHDIISEWDDNGFAADADIVRFDASVNPLTLVLSRQQGDLIATLPSGEGLILQRFFYEDNTHQRNLTLAFADGSQWDMERIQCEIFRSDAGLTRSIVGTRGSDTLTGNATYSYSEYLYGGVGNDALNGRGGNDWLDGGSGDDSLTGGNGTDTYRFGVGAGHDVVTDSAAAVVYDRIRLDFTTGISDLTIEMLAGTDSLRIGRHDASGVVTDSIIVNRNIGRLMDVTGNDIMLEDPETLESRTLLSFVNGGLADRTITLLKNSGEDRYVVLSASDLLANTFSDVEAVRWNLMHVEKISGSFSKTDVDGDGATEEAFFYLKNFLGDGVNHVAFLPSTEAGDASFRYAIRRDDGLVIVSTINISMQDVVLSGTAGNDIIDGGQDSTGLLVDGGAGHDIIRDGYGNDSVYGGDGNDILTHNWAGNGDDMFYGGAGDDTLDAGWGVDRLAGDAGNDLYIENNLWSGDHTVIDNTTAATGDVDTLQIGREGYGMWDYRSLWFSRSGDDLLITQLDALEAGEIRVNRWYDATLPEAKLDLIRVQQDDGNVYEAAINTGFEALVQAMAGFPQPASIAEISGELHSRYNTVWHLAVPAA